MKEVNESVSFSAPDSPAGSFGTGAGRGIAAGTGIAGVGASVNNGFWSRFAGRAKDYLPMLPFFLFTLMFMILPAASLLVGGFQDKSGAFTFDNIVKLGNENILSAYWITVQISLASAVGGVVVGFALAWALSHGGLPKSLRFITTTFSGVASNFAGVPLAFAFIATLGRVGLITTILRAAFGIELYDSGFNLYGFWGLALTYLYFQVPLMVLVILPAIDGLKKEWNEAVLSLGGSRFRYWREVAFPVLAPSIFAAFLLLFGNAFGAYATAYALTGGLLNLVPILIGAQIRGDVLHDPNLGYALALGMVVIMTVVIALNNILNKAAAKWRN